MLLSFIVPVYNTCLYLDKCLASIYDQGLPLHEFELIVINDGSTDDSSTILDRWAREKPNLFVVSQENRGLSVARNVGLAKAVGQYIQFVDSDDWLNTGVIVHLLDRCVVNDLDILSFDLVRVNELGCQKYYPKNIKLSNRVFCGEELLGHAFIQAPVCKYIIKRDLLLNNSIVFFPSIFHEDEEFTPRMFLFADKVMLTNTLVYNHFTRTNSITQNVHNQERSLKDKISVALMISTYSKSQSLRSSQMSALIARNNQLIVDIFVSIAKMKSWKSNFVAFKQIMAENQIYPSLSRNLSSQGMILLVMSRSFVLFKIFVFIYGFRTRF